MCEHCWQPGGQQAPPEPTHEVQAVNSRTVASEQTCLVSVTHAEQQHIGAGKEVCGECVCVVMEPRMKGDGGQGIIGEMQ